jgi:hypothetical protein
MELGKKVFTVNIYLFTCFCQLFIHDGDPAKTALQNILEPKISEYRLVKPVRALLVWLIMKICESGSE